MILFDETENKYYEFLAYLLHGGDSYSRSEINKMLEKYLPGEPDFEVTEALLEAEEGSELIFYRDNDLLKPILSNQFPIRNSVIENQALKSLLLDSYKQHFLAEETIEKIRKVTADICEEWNPNEITIKNLFSKGASQTERIYSNDMSVIAKAIREKRAIKYDNIRPGRVELKSVKSFPVKIEFSVVNDKFRVCAYEPKGHRFIKMNLDSMQHIVLDEEIVELDLQEEYREFLKINTKKVVLDVEPVGHVIERCFRVFSYYDRKARFDREENKYRLEIFYLKADENEIIKNILSMGSSVLVIEPHGIQKEVYRRIKMACHLYDL